MVRKQSRKQAKKSIKHRVNSYNFFLVLAVLLGMIAGVFMVKAFYKGERVNTKPTVSVANLAVPGASSGKDGRVKYQAEIALLEAFLLRKATEDCNAIQKDTPPAQYKTLAANHEVTQALLGYGCGDTEARMFVVRDDNEWKFISPTNQFDPLTTLPSCDHVKENSISKEIAPVCFTAEDQTVEYRVR